MQPDRSFLLLSAAVITATLLFGGVSAGLFWNVLNAVGFIAYAGLLYLCVQGQMRRHPKLHQSISYAVLFLVLLHAVALPLLDPLVLLYLQPGAPYYMWAGLLSTLLLALAIFSALPAFRQSSYASSHGFRFWHRVLSATIVLAAAYHIIGSGLFIKHPIQVALFLLISIPALRSITWFARGVQGGRALAWFMAALCLAGFLGLALSWRTWVIAA